MSLALSLDACTLETCVNVTLNVCFNPNYPNVSNMYVFTVEVYVIVTVSLIGVHEMR